ncbi:hypothetical protein [Microbacterium sp.]|uniref:hypothetical protein n=1 Tax=Microbacterium sp. TaxID=51671 RepID=UPI0039E6165E
MRARHYAAPRPTVVERERIERKLRPSARDLFPVLRTRLLESRPIIGDQKPRRGADGIRTTLLPVYGKPTFRNVVDENGRLV